MTESTELQLCCDTCTCTNSHSSTPREPSDDATPESNVQES